MLIYCAFNIINGKRYIGLTTMTLKSRWSCHVNRALNEGSDTILCQAIRKYGKEAFVVEEIATLPPGGSVEDLQNLERTLIAQEGTKAPHGYNMTDGGDSTHGYKHTQEQLTARKYRKTISDTTRAKMSLAHKGKRRHTEESKKKIGSYHKGKVVSVVTREKLRQAHVIKPQIMSEAGKAKIRAVHTGKVLSAETIAKMNATRAANKLKLVS